MSEAIARPKTAKHSNSKGAPTRCPTLPTHLVETPTRYAAPRSSRKPSAKSVAPSSSASFSPDAIKAAFGIVEVLLNEAYGTDEAHDWSGDSDRLIRVAHNLADKANISPPTGSDVDGIAFNIAALIRAARLVPGDSESPERKALLDQAAVQLDWLTESSGCCDPGVPRPAGPTKAVAPHPVDPNDLSVQREAINQASYRIQSALDTVELGIDATGEDELRGVRILVEDMVNRFGDAADLPDLGGPSGIAWDISCALSIVLATVQRINEHNMDNAVLYAVTYLLESAKQLVDHACDNWPSTQEKHA